MTILGDLVKQMREAAGISQKKLGALCGLSDSTIMKIESGVNKTPSLEKLCNIAKALGFSPLEFMAAIGQVTEKDIKHYKPVSGLEKLDNSDLAFVQRFIDFLNAEKRPASAPEPNLSRMFRLGELFCGPGGIAWGALNADIGNPEFKIVHQWANDYDLNTCKTYRRNICPATPASVICGDVRTLDMDMLAPIDALAFGFPCNDFSVVGEKKGFDGEFGPLYSYGVKALRKFRPQWFVAENVGGLRSANSGVAFKKILSELRGTGYRLTPHLYKFEEYGIPQARHRIIIVGIRDDISAEYRVPSPEPYKNADNSCRTAITQPPIPADAFNNETTAQSPAVVERLLHIRPGQNAFSALLPEHLRLKIKGAKISMIYKRLDPERPSYTVTGSGGGGTHIYHWEEPRALTNRERARLQTFPDDFEFLGSKESVRKQIGMAVPCRGAKIIFEAILKTFAGIGYPSAEPNIIE